MTCVAAQAYVALNQPERAVRHGVEGTAFFDRDPLLAGIREQPRFRQIRESVASQRRKRSP